MSKPQLTEAQKRALHHCACGHLIENHDFTGCFAHSEDFTPCSCEETFEGKLFTTTYCAVAALVAEHTQALEAEVARLKDMARRSRQMRRVWDAEERAEVAEAKVQLLWALLDGGDH